MLLNHVGLEKLIEFFLSLVGVEGRRDAVLSGKVKSNKENFILEKTHTGARHQFKSFAFTHYDDNIRFVKISAKHMIFSRLFTQYLGSLPRSSDYYY